MLRNVVPIIVLALIGCVTEDQAVECDLVCTKDKIKVNQLTECKFVDVETTEMVCIMHEVQMPQANCSTQEVSVNVPYTYTTLDCSNSSNTHTDSVCGTDSVSYTTTSCETNLQDVTEEVCGTEEHTFTTMTCLDLTQTVTEELCETQESQERVVMDFDSVDPGSRLETLYQDVGVTLAVFEYHSNTPALGAVAFDSENPTGGDYDLGTGNESWNGPGEGSGGFATNFFGRGNLLISAENLEDDNQDGLVDDPDDDASGATFVFTFDQEVCINQFDFIDVESSETADYELYSPAGLIASQLIEGLGNNSFQRVDPEVCGVTELHISLCSSAALDNVTFTRSMEGEVCLDHEYQYTTSECDEELISEEVSVCTDFSYQTEDVTCSDVNETQSVNTCLDYEYSCDETSCQEVAATGSVEYTYEDVDCDISYFPKPEKVCDEVTITDRVEICYEIPVHEFVETCVPDPECAPDSTWVQGGGGFLGQ